jgi:hypothetical protein
MTFIRPETGLSRIQTQGCSRPMGKIAGILLVTVLLVLVGGGIFLATFDLPAPKARVEKVINDDRLPK